MYLTHEESETRPTMNAHEFNNYEIRFGLKNPYTSIEKENYRYA
jgi:hypothetical protein